MPDGIESADLRSVALLRQNLKVHFSRVQRSLAEGRTSRASETIGSIQELVELLLDRVDLLLEIDRRRTVEVVMLLDRLRHYELDLFA
jgi:hypothetical protein